MIEYDRNHVLCIVVIRRILKSTIREMQNIRVYLFSIFENCFLFS